MLFRSVTFDIDANGILHVKAKDKATSKEQSIQITATTNLSKDEVENLVQDAKSHEADDRVKREAVEARNAADGLIYATEKSMRELGDKVKPGDREQIEQTITDLRAAMESENTERMKTLSEQLQQASGALAQQIYQQQAASEDGTKSGSKSNPGGAAEDEDVVEGEFRQV